MSFLAKAINKAQHLSIEDRFCAALNEYITRVGNVLWDDERALFWVEHPKDGWQVATWLMPIASRFKPSPGSPLAGLGVKVKEPSQ